MNQAYILHSRTSHREPSKQGRWAWAPYRPVAGTMCGDWPQGTFVDKAGNCRECDYYQCVQQMENIVFGVDQTLSIETHYKAYLQTQILGWKKGVFILTEGIYVQGQPAKLQANDICKVRFLGDGNAYGFLSEVLTIQFFPHPMMFLKFPDKIESVKIRVAPRFKVDLPAAFKDASGTVISEALLLDISDNGCGLKVPFIEDRELAPEAGYKMAFKVLDREINIDCALKNIARKSDACFIGMEFTDMTPQDKNTLSQLLSLFKTNSGRS